MGVRPPRHPRSRPPAAQPPPLQLLLLLLPLLAGMAAGQNHVGRHLCDMDACTRAYDNALTVRGLQGPEGSPAFCEVLYDYGTCMYQIRSGCRGNLNYHTSNTMLIHLKTRFDCAVQLEQAYGSPTGAPRKHPSTTRTPPTVAPVGVPLPGGDPSEGVGSPAQPPERCTFQGRRVFRHCGLFGDPHLKTFQGVMQTCRVQGAWPLVDNPFLAVQVTNEHVLPNSPATATTKVTVIVKSSSTHCTTQKTYEATAEAPLPDTFIDGTNRSDAVSLQHRQTPYGASVEIYLRYIATTVIVRKVGRYLAFSTRMPEELVSSFQEGAGLQLCVKGCPQSERMDLASDRGHVLGWTDALERCASRKSVSPQTLSDSQGESRPMSPSQDTNEVMTDLTDQYLDWCVFDLMTTGKDDFVLAARSAHRDTLAMDPGALRNRTTAQLGWDLGPGSGSGSGAGAGAGLAVASSASWSAPSPSLCAPAVLLLAALLLPRSSLTSL